MDRSTVEERLAYWKEHLGRLMDAYVALIEGGVKNYKIDDRELTRFDLPSLKKAIDDAEKKVDQYEAMLDGLKPRRAFAVVPRDY